jgi:spore coat protein U-like protein
MSARACRTAWRGARRTVRASLALFLCTSAALRAAPIVNCTTTATSIAFGIYNPLNTVGTASTGTISVTCTATGSGTTNITVTASLSTGMSGSYTTRTMRSGVNALDYNIYLSPAYTQVFGNGTGGSYTVSEGPITISAGQGGSGSGTMYGYIPPLQNAVPGAYADVITLTVTY